MHKFLCIYMLPHYNSYALFLSLFRILWYWNVVNPSTYQHYVEICELHSNRTNNHLKMVVSQCTLLAPSQTMYLYDWQAHNVPAPQSKLSTDGLKFVMVIVSHLTNPEKTLKMWVSALRIKKRNKLWGRMAWLFCRQIVMFFFYHSIFSYHKLQR